MSLDPAGPSYVWWCWDRCYVLLTSDPMILGMLEHLNVALPLGVLGSEFASQVIQHRLEGTLVQISLRDIFISFFKGDLLYI